MKYIGVDLGSSFVKAVLLDLDHGRIIAQDKSASPRRQPNPNPNYFEIPAKKLVDTVRKLIDKYTEEYKDVEGVIISTQMHGFIYSVPDREDIYVSWQDMRCLDRRPGEDRTYLEWMEEHISRKQMENHGVYLKPSLGLCNLYTLLSEDLKLPRNGTLHTLGSYVIYSLTGNYVCHISNAAPLGLSDVANRCWNKELLKKMGLGEVKLPELVEHDYKVCGEYVSNGCLLKIHPDYGDMQVAILGSGISQGDVAVNIATGAQVIRCDKNFRPGSYEIRPYFDGMYLYTISNMPSGRNLDVLIRFFQEIVEQMTGTYMEAQEIWKVVHAQELKHDEDLSVETSFYRNPYFPDGGAIRGITHSNLHLETVFYAAFRDMAETYWHYIQELGESPECIRRIVCAGGVNWKTPQIRGLLAQISGKECELSPMADEALSGMYQLSLVCSGKCGSIEECAAYPLQQ